MITVLLFWVLIFVIFLIIGVSFFTFIGWIQKTGGNGNALKIDECFFAGFVLLSALSGILSVLMPVGFKLFCLVTIATIPLLALSYKETLSLIKRSVLQRSEFKKSELALFSLLSLFVLMAVVQKITWLDTQSYHAQNIQWIQKYAVVPGLGNLHDRFAFNSMFFVISALFTFQIKDVLIFPLNSICYIVVAAKLFTLYKKEISNGVHWKATLYVLTVLISLFIMLPNINTPSPDIICASIIIYIFVIILDNNAGQSKSDISLFILINLLVFSCIAYKISSLFLALVLLFFLDNDLVRRGLIIIGIGTLILVPFLIRNYILSGYLIYPFPSIDIFSPDWKIPFKNVIETKSVIEGWAKIPVRPYSEVLSLRCTEWIVPWFKQLSGNSKLLVLVNFLSLFTTIRMILRKEYNLAKIQLILIINLVFWFFKAPDPRFAYGFLFIGFSFNISYLIKIIGTSFYMATAKHMTIILTCLIFIILAKRLIIPLNIIYNTSLLIKPAPFDIVETREYFTNFKYRIPENDKECFNTAVPCVVYELTDVVMRGNDLSSGFKVVNEVKK